VQPLDVVLHGDGRHILASRGDDELLVAARDTDQATRVLK
jgi:hypothetical protein